MARSPLERRRASHDIGGGDQVAVTVVCERPLPQRPVLHENDPAICVVREGQRASRRVGDRRQLPGQVIRVRVRVLTPVLVGEEPPIVCKHTGSLGLLVLERPTERTPASIYVVGDLRTATLPRESMEGPIFVLQDPRSRHVAGHACTQGADPSVSERAILQRETVVRPHDGIGQTICRPVEILYTQDQVAVGGVDRGAVRLAVTQLLNRPVVFGPQALGIRHRERSSVPVSHRCLSGKRQCEAVVCAWVEEPVIYYGSNVDKLRLEGATTEQDIRRLCRLRIPCDSLRRPGRRDLVTADLWVITGVPPFPPAAAQ